MDLSIYIWISALGCRVQVANTQRQRAREAARCSYSYVTSGELRLDFIRVGVLRLVLVSVHRDLLVHQISVDRSRRRRDWSTLQAKEGETTLPPSLRPPSNTPNRPMPLRW